jgi:hypothetical protein
MSVYHIAVAVATAVEAIDTETRHLPVAERPQQQMAVSCGTHYIVCCTFVFGM